MVKANDMHGYYWATKLEYYLLIFDKHYFWMTLNVCKVHSKSNKKSRRKLLQYDTEWCAVSLWQQIKFDVNTHSTSKSHRPLWLYYSTHTADTTRAIWRCSVGFCPLSSPWSHWNFSTLVMAADHLITDKTCVNSEDTTQMNNMATT